VLSGGGDDAAFLWRSDTGALVHELRGHGDSVVAVGFNAAGTLVATGSYDQTVRVWAVASGALLHTLEGPSGEVEWLAWHPKGDVLLAGAMDATAWMWHVTPAAATCMQVFAGEGAGRRRRRAAAAAHDGNGDKSCANDAALPSALFVAGHEAEVSCGGFTGSGKAVVTGSGDASARVWDPKSGACVTTFAGHGWHEEPVNALACAKDVSARRRPPRGLR
jgi:WD40 repeat protein